ncbi:MAG: photosystem II S4 domain protein [Firmicutes bacterium]|nr:photosystem II S4 domain protein [Bacillota bacterium]
MTTSQRLDAQESLFLNRVQEWLMRALDRQEPNLTPFLDPRQLGLLLRHTSGYALAVESWGGYPGAERCRAVLAPEYWSIQEETFQLAYLQVQVPPGARLDHSDYLGALIGLGLSRDVLGDLLVGAHDCQAILAAPVLPVVLQELHQVGRYEAKAVPISADQLHPLAPRIKEIRTTVSAARLDAVASAGFGLSRSQVAGLIKGGKARVNWGVVAEPSAHVREGDVISLRGHGRIRLMQLGPATKGGRLHLQVIRYL